MNLSSRWCVTAVFACGALACSDPVPPPAQGAFIAQVQSQSPAPANKMCPAGAAFTYDVPGVQETDPTKVLTELYYNRKIIDGEDGAEVRCSVKGGSTFTFSGRIFSQGKALELSSGTLGADKKGTARITVTNSTRISGSMISPAPPDCVIDAAKTGSNNFQVKAGSMWASFNCPAVESPPTNSCLAKGIFVLENCDQ